MPTARFLINLFTKSEIAEGVGAVHGQGPGEFCTRDWETRESPDGRILLIKKIMGATVTPSPLPDKKTQK
jgi:hypothetical protein